MKRDSDAALEEEPEGVRDRILDAALAILRESGIRKLSQVQVARRAGVRQSHLTHYFPKRHDLLDAITTRFVDGVAKGLREAVAESPVDGERAMLESLSRAIREREHMWMFTGVMVEADGRALGNPSLRVRHGGADGARHLGETHGIPLRAGRVIRPEVVKDGAPRDQGPVSPVARRHGFWAPAIHDLGHPQVVRFRLEPSQGT